MSRRSNITLFFVACILLACQQNTDSDKDNNCFQLPAGTHLPRLYKSFDRLDKPRLEPIYDLSISYVKSDSSGLNGLYSHEIDSLGKSSPRLLAEGDNWFINWADFPSVASFSAGGRVGLFAHWLEYSGEGTYDYDIRYRAKLFHGLDEPKTLHNDSISAEHGFVSTSSTPENLLQVTWLDGGYTKQDMGAAAGADKVEGQGDGHGHGAGAMTLRTKKLYGMDTEVELDHRVCDCCNTATVATDSLTMIAYRDRSEHEIRDIAYVVKQNLPGNKKNWSTPKLVHADNWEINGCPVNGPALAANQSEDIAIVWYTAANDDTRLQFARYDAANDRFTSPTLLDDNDPLGRVDIQLADDGTAYVTGLTTKENTADAFLTLWTISPKGKIEREDLTTTSPARSSGFPKIALFEDKLYWTRTVVGAEKGEQFVEVCWR